MTTYDYTAITNGQVINFSVGGGDTVNFNIPALGAFNLNFEPVGADVLFTIRDNSNVVVKTFTLQNLSPYQMSSSMFSFQNGSRFKLGDNSSATGDDAATGNLTGTAQGDMLISAGGAQLVEGLGGDDSLATVGAGGGQSGGGTGVDTLDGGDGNDWLSLAGVSEAQKYTLTLNGSTDASLGILGALDVPVSNASAVVRNIENVDGSDVIDVITGDANANKLIGNNGNDTLDGGGGDDTLIGGAGADSLIGGAGTGDVVDYSGDGDNLGDKLGVVVNLSSATGAGANWQGVTFGVVATNTALDGTGSVDSLSGIERIIGSDYNDYLLGNASAQYINGGKGSDLIGAGGGGDTIDGGTTGADVSFDWLSYGAAGGSISVNLGAHTGSGLTSLQNIDGVIGGNFNDTLTGGDATNQWFNGDKFEWFQGNAGNDSIDGGRGTIATMTEATREYNIARYAGATGSVTVDLAAGTASDGLSGTDTLVGINGAWGSSNADTLNGGNATFDLVEVFEGNGGNDSINGGSGLDIAMYRSATAAVTVDLGNSTATADGLGGTDILHNIEGVVGSDFADSLTGSSGDNVFQGRKGNDTLNGAGGNDTADYHGDENANSDQLGVVVNLGGATGPSTWQGVAYNVAGSTAQDGWGNTDTLTSIENIRGSIYNDVLIGDGNANTITGGSGSDKIDGGLGTDIAVYTGNKALYTVTDQGAGVWTVQGDGGATDTLTNIETLQFSDQSQSLVGGGPQSYNFDTMSNGDAVAFDPAVDSFNSPTLGIQLLDFSPIESGLNAGRGLELRQTNQQTGQTIKTVQLLFTAGSDATNMFKVNSAHITFNGGKLLIGDDLVTTDDDSTAVTLTGTAGNDVLISAGGSQTLNGGDGNDRLMTLERQTSAGSSGLTDIFNGGNGTDTLALDKGRISGGGEIVQYTVSLASNTGSIATTGGANDSSFTMSGIENVDGSDVIDHITGNAGDNDLKGANGNDSLYGGDGNDSLDGGRGNDLLNGGAGRDAAFYSRDTDSNAVNANLTTGQAVQGSYTDTLVSIETLIGSQGADTLTGNTANINTFTSSFISDVLMGMAGNDTLNGGNTAASTVVLASYQSDQAAVTVNLTTGQATDGWGNTDTLTNIDGVIGSGFNDSITGGSSSAQIIAGNFFEIFDGGAGNDTINGADGTDRVQYNNATGGVTVVLDTVLGGTYAGTATGNGSVGSDTLLNIEHVVGSNFADTLTGGDSNDGFEGFGGSDTIHGLGGIDTIRYDRSTSAVTVTFTAAGVGTATDGLGGTDTFDGIESARGSDNNDTFTGSAADESFEGMAGNDTINGGGGIDTVRYSGGGAGVTVVLAGGAATVTDAWGGTDSLTGIENIQGSLFNDSLTGDASDNVLQGLSGNDTLTGGLGKDTALYLGNKADYTIAKIAVGQYTVTDINSSNGNDGVDSLFGIEKLQFLDGSTDLGKKLLGHDYNGDSKADLLWKNATTGQLYMDVMNGAAIQSQGFVVGNTSADWQVIDAKSDYNGDSNSDILYWNGTLGAAYLYTMNGTTVQSGGFVVQNVAAGWSIIESKADYNGDSKADLLWKNATTGQLYMDVMNGAAIQSQGFVVGNTSADWQVIDAKSDYNGDSNSDILYWNGTLGAAYLYTMNGTTVQSGGFVVQNVAAGWSIIESKADYNGDSKADLLWKNATTGQLYMDVMNGAAIQSQRFVVGNTSADWQVIDAKSDYNGDSNSDILYWNSTLGSAYMYQMNGTAIQNGGFVVQNVAADWGMLS
jgi:Ca2+-binding RTX toxin-like protein